MKKFKVVAESVDMDVEIKVETMNEAHGIFKKFKKLCDTCYYYRVYIVDNETGELYRTYDISHQAGGVMIQEWYTIGG